MKKQTLATDLLTLINTGTWLRDKAESHLDVWKERYCTKTKKQARFDLDMNHDPSCEIEDAEEELKRKLTDEEYNYLVEAFNKKVVSLHKKTDW